MQDIQRENLDHKETGATEIPDGKRHEKTPEPVDTVAQVRISHLFCLNTYASCKRI